MSANTERSDSSPWTEAVASLALLSYSLVVAAGFARVFSGWEFFDNLAVVTIAGHAISYALRLMKTPVWIAFPVTTAALIWLIAAMFYRDTMSLLLPTSETWDRFTLDLDLAGGNFREEVAPVLFLEGWDVLATIGIAASVLLADTFAFRAFARAESLVPGGVLFVFIAALGDDRGRVASTMALVGAGVVATVILRHHHAPPKSTSIGSPRGFIPARAVPVALGSALCVALIAGFVGPRLPGAGADPIYDTNRGSGGNVTNVISPLVDIQSRLTNRSTTELFVVTADADSYWRTSALAEFDGQRWGIPPRSLNSTDSIGDAAEGSVSIRQEIRITNLGGVLLPAAADPIAASGVGDVNDSLRISADGATLVKTEGDLTTGDTFLVESASPRFSSAALANATSNNPGDDIYLALPDDFPASVSNAAREVTAGTTTPYEAALAVQNWMRSEFTYSLEIQGGHDNSAVESFLINRVGYCEQFAGTYAAMMRSIDIPARVAVGFTPGTNDGAGNYTVLGRNAHAWPEVWFDGFGWVPFEPTPGRGAPNAQEYTGVDQQQDDGPVGGQPDENDAGAAPTAPPPTAIAPGGTGPGPSQTTVPAAPAPATPKPPTAPLSGSVSGGPIPWPAPVAVLLLVGGLALPALVRRVRRSAVTTPEDQLAQLWRRATSALSAMGLEVAADRTPTETASSTSAVFPVATRPMLSLAEVITETTFAPSGADRLTAVGGYGTTLLQSCVGWCRQIERSVTDSLGPSDRIRRYFTTWR
jgi:transglutaminase-like putative cysteine protease